MLRHDMRYHRGTIVVDNTSTFKSTIFLEYGTNRRSWPSLLQGAFAPGFRQYVDESSPEVKLEPEPPRVQEILDLDSPSPLIVVPRPEVVIIDSSPSPEGRTFIYFLCAWFRLYL